MQKYATKSICEFLALLLAIASRLQFRGILFDERRRVRKTQNVDALSLDRFLKVDFLDMCFLDMCICILRCMCIYKRTKRAMD